MPPGISVIIPTHNRRASVQRTLRALCQQSLPPEQFEVIVVADGCSDDTATVLPAEAWPFTLQVISQPAARAGAARNRGAAAAQGEWLAFLDDDIEAAPEWLAAHCQALAGRPRAVSVGYLVVPPEPQETIFQEELRYWWEAMFMPLRENGYRFNYTNLLSGNFALARALFAEAGGFSPNLLCHEDYELGYRLIQCGAEIAYTQEAWGWHHDRTRLPRAIARKYEEGVDDARLGAWHPELKPVLFVSRLLQNHWLTYPALLELVFRAPALAAALTGAGRLLLAGLERLQVRWLYRRLLNPVLAYGYCVGLKAELGSYAALQNFLETAPAGKAAPPLDLDLEPGIEAAARRLDVERPAAARLRYGDTLLGELASQPGAEPLQGRHLKGELVRLYAPQLARIAGLPAAGVG